MRTMVDVTHDGLPNALTVIDGLLTGDVVALYDTGSPDIAATPADIAEIPTHLTTIFIDQGFTGSPNLHATVRDCENGTWLLSDAVNKTGWAVQRPTLYLGYPDTAQQAFDLGWQGDVWLVMPSAKPPTSPPPVPKGINVVAIQWDFSDPNFDVSDIYDGSWPKMATPPIPQPPPGQWLNAKNWTWQGVTIVGLGLNGHVYQFIYDKTTGKWNGPVLIALRSKRT